METSAYSKDTRRKYNKTQYIRLLGVVAVIVIILASFLLYVSWPLLTGKTTVLATRPVDPFDPFRGQYIIINYEISRVSSLLQAQKGEDVYILLKEDEKGVARFSSVSFAKPDPDKLFIKGDVINNNGDTMQIEYGIEQYFFERNANLPTVNLTVEVKISSSGQARINRLLQNGKTLVIDYDN